MRADTERKVRKFIEDNFLFREDRAAVSDAESLIDAGLIDSTGVLELVAFLEGEFGLRMADAEIVPENLDSIRAIVAFVEGKHAADSQSSSPAKLVPAQAGSGDPVNTDLSIVPRPVVTGCPAFAGHDESELI
jgi:acyl carrier protein